MVGHPPLSSGNKEMADEELEIKIDIVELNGKIDRMTDSLDVVRARLDEIVNGIDSLKSAVYNPDEGLYARIKQLEQWRDQTSRFLWLVATSIVGLSTATIWKHFF